VSVALLAVRFRTDVHGRIDRLARVVPASADLHFPVTGTVASGSPFLTGAVVARGENDRITREPYFLSATSGHYPGYATVVVPNDRSGFRVVVHRSAFIFELFDELCDQLFSVEPYAPRGVSRVRGLVFPVEPASGQPLEGVDRAVSDPSGQLPVGAVISHLHDVRVEVGRRVIADIAFRVDIDVGRRNSERLGESRVSASMLFRGLFHPDGRASLGRPQAGRQASGAASDDDDVVTCFARLFTALRWTGRNVDRGPNRSSRDPCAADDEQEEIRSH
jgi:hypothetical protein